jgi:RimJ/RimL family protein N-acetyltransferase
MLADPDVMADGDGVLNQAQSADKLAGYMQDYEYFGYCRWCVETHAQQFVGYVGINHRAAHAQLGQHDEIGWRLNTAYWGQGMATEAAAAALLDARNRLKLGTILSCTSPSNLRSQRVMEKLGMRRAKELDYEWSDGKNQSLPVIVWASE